MRDFLEQLAELEVRRPPPEFDRHLHERLNRTLLVQHFVDLVFGAMPWALVHLLQAVIGLVAFSITGKYPSRNEALPTDDEQQGTAGD
jgi:hypothetical protein